LFLKFNEKEDIVHVLIVYGIPEHVTCSVRKKMKNNLRFSVSSIPELHITQSEVSVYLQKDLDQPVSGKEIVVFVDGLFKKPERMPWVKDHVAAVVGREIAKYFPRALVEVFVRSFNPISGFWTSECKN
jgi:sporulation-control protein spo0M